MIQNFYWFLILEPKNISTYSFFLHLLPFTCFFMQRNDDICYVPYYNNNTLWWTIKHVKERFVIQHLRAYTFIIEQYPYSYVRADVCEGVCMCLYSHEWIDNSFLWIMLLIVCYRVNNSIYRKYSLKLIQCPRPNAHSQNGILLQEKVYWLPIKRMNEKIRLYWDNL